MGNFVLARMAQSLISLIGLVVLVFFLVRLTGSPADLYLPDDASEAARQEYIRIHGLDRPMIVQFWEFFSGLFRLDLGESLRQARPAAQIVLEAYPTSLKLAGLTMLISVIGAVLLGVWAAVRPTGLLDRVISILSLASASAPNFWVALTLISVFAVWLRVVPTSGIGGWEYWILPITVLTLRPLGLLAQVVREAMIRALTAPYVRTAKSKGVPFRSVLFVHALRNASLPILTMAGNQAVGFINGSVVIESIFGFPGVGKLMIDAIQQRDFAVVQAGVVITAVVIFLMNILIDVAYALLDPRIRHK
ncbi:ABC transporter permease [Alterinioella nitratireducens]|jgi:peptide/nickel transport system permease protein|uniref:ABC transporter permease n=1 Tax=Alterinioella nitratireducens TaxID=2735915 RepID=UPI0015570C20|nr:ABC transporter permease [Alterinioella nitratireducens]NPD18801.1 ABC transporter permease [Alterinioella nitratireducens]